MGILVGSALLMGSCDQGTAPADAPGGRLVGSWTWVRSEGGIAGEVRRPPPAVRLVFGNDGSFAYYKDDTLQARTSYTLVREQSPFGPDTIDVIRFAASDRFQAQAFSISGESLLLSDLCIDCYGHQYVRFR